MCANWENIQRKARTVSRKIYVKIDTNRSAIKLRANTWMDIDTEMAAPPWTPLTTGVLIQNVKMIFSAYGTVYVHKTDEYGEPD